MNGIRERASPVLLALVMAPLWSGCAGTEDSVAFEDTPAGAIMTRLRARHGSVERFRRLAGVVFSYRVEFRGRVREFDRVGFRFGDPDHLWIRPAADTQTLLVTLREQGTPIRGHPIAAIATAAIRDDQSGLAGARALEGLEGPVRRERFAEPELDLALRSIRLLLEPSLTTCFGRWRYRTLVAPGHAADTDRLEVEPWPSFGFDGHCLLEDDPRTGLLARVLYRGSHPVVRGHTQLVAFDDYASVQGIQVARRRVHRRPIDTDELKLTRNPFVDPPRKREETFLVERLGAIRFLTAAEADELLPLPLGDDA